LTQTSTIKYPAFQRISRPQCADKHQLLVPCFDQSQNSQPQLLEISSPLFTHALDEFQNPFKADDLCHSWLDHSRCRPWLGLPHACMSLLGVFFFF